jgi:hypothetical protein
VYGIRQLTIIEGDLIGNEYTGKVRLIVTFLVDETAQQRILQGLSLIPTSNWKMVKIAVVGAGIIGLSTAVCLQKQFPQTEVTCSYTPMHFQRIKTLPETR